MGSSQVAQALMGGVGVGITDPFSVIQVNPASYAGLRTPVFETGAVTRLLRYEREEVKATGRRTDLMGLTLGIPIGRGSILQGGSQLANRWGFALGVQPVSHVGYGISDPRHIPEAGGDVRFEYTGDGGLNRAFIGTALTLWQNNDTLLRGSRLAIGANLNYLFGRIEETRKVYYPQAGNHYNSSITSELIIRSPTVNTGLQLSGVFGDARPVNSTTEADPRTPWRYTVGVSAELPAMLSAERTELVNTFIIGSTGVEFPVDTVIFRDGAKGSVDLPLLLGAGLSITNARWTFALEHRRRDWTDLRIEVEGHATRSQLATHEIYSFGTSFRPMGDRLGGTIWQRSIYRGGIRYNRDHRIVHDQRLQEIGIAFGIGVPIMSNITRSRINFGVEAGERGTTDQGLLRERYINILVGVTITPDVREQWFKKKRLE